MRTRRFALPAAAFLVGALAIVTAKASKHRPAEHQQGGDTASIVRFAQDLASSIRLQNVNRIMSHYARNDLTVFDASPPFLYTSWQAYRESWRRDMASIDSFDKMQMYDIHARASGDLGYFSAQWHSEATTSHGAKETADGCMTDVLQKFNGRWLIIHEHDSMTTGAPTVAPKNGGEGDASDFIDPAYRGDGRSGIEGTVMAGPIRPTSRTGEPNERPLANKAVSIRLAPNGSDIAQTHTDAQGHFRLVLAPGAYQIVTHGGGIFDRPYATTVHDDAFTHLTLHYDTGIR